MKTFAQQRTDGVLLAFALLRGEGEEATRRAFGGVPLSGSVRCAPLTPELRACLDTLTLDALLRELSRDQTESIERVHTQDPSPCLGAR